VQSHGAIPADWSNNIGPLPAAIRSGWYLCGCVGNDFHDQLDLVLGARGIGVEIIHDGLFGSQLIGIGTSAQTNEPTNLGVARDGRSLR